MKFVTSVLFLCAVSQFSAVAAVIYEPYTITTVFGWGGSGSQDGTGIEARFSYPRSGAFDRAGNLYVSDSGNDTIRKISPTGVVTTFAGMAGQAGSDDGQGSAARFNLPGEIAIDRANNLYVADESNNTIRKITPDALVTTIAGSPGVFGYVDGPGSEALFSYPYGMAIDHAGNLFVSDENNEVIRKITPEDVVSTFAGGGCCENDGTGTEAGFFSLEGIGIDKDDNIYATEYVTEQVRKITPDAVVTHFNRSGDYRMCDDVVFGRDGNVYTSAIGQINMTPPEGAGAVFAGGYIGSEDGRRTIAQFYYPSGLVFDHFGNLFVIDVQNSNIRRISRQGAVTTFAGLADEGSRDAVGTEARFYSPQGIVSNGRGGFYICDSANATIRKADSTGAVTTIAGKVFRTGFVDGKGSRARFNSPTAIARDLSGNLYIADRGNNAVRKIDSKGNVSTVAPGSFFSYPNGIAVDSSGNVYVSATADKTIFKITPDGQVSVLANGFVNPQGIALDGDGNVYVADDDANLIMKVTPAGVVTTLAGSGRHGNNDGPAATASFRSPAGVAVDGAGNVFVSDTENSTIRKISLAGQVTTIAGSPQQWDWKDGTGADARFRFPLGIIVDGSGSVYIADWSSNTIRKGVAAH